MEQFPYQISIKSINTFPSYMSKTAVCKATNRLQHDLCRWRVQQTDNEWTILFFVYATVLKEYIKKKTNTTYIRAVRHKSWSSTVSPYLLFLSHEKDQGTLMIYPHIRFQISSFSGKLVITTSFTVSFIQILYDHHIVILHCTKTIWTEVIYSLKI
jgi:hypothetical protein